MESQATLLSCRGTIALHVSRVMLNAPTAVCDGSTSESRTCADKGTSFFHAFKITRKVLSPAEAGQSYKTLHMSKHFIPDKIVWPNALWSCSQNEPFFLNWTWFLTDCYHFGQYRNVSLG